MSINDFVEMTSFLCLIHFSIYANIQATCKNGHQECQGKIMFGKKWQKTWLYHGGQKFRQNCSISHRFWDGFSAEIQDGWKTIL